MAEMFLVGHSMEPRETGKPLLVLRYLQTNGRMLL
jgi:hypothetical protein